MIVTVLWEDQRGVEARSFGPHELLLACVRDDVGLERSRLQALVKSQPKKGNGGVRRALRDDLRRLENDGPVFAVIDRDKVLDLWKTSPPSDCRKGIVDRFRQDIPGPYDLVLLEHNVETVIDATCRALEIDAPSRKPGPDERDRLLGRAAWPTPNAARPFAARARASTVWSAGSCSTSRAPSGANGRSYGAGDAIQLANGARVAIDAVYEGAFELDAG